MENFKLVMVFLFSSQCVIAGCLLLLGNTFYQFYSDALINKPKNIISKIYNLVFYLLMGVAAFFYKKNANRNWLLRRLLFAPWILLMIFTSILIYYAVTAVWN